MLVQLLDGSSQWRGPEVAFIPLYKLSQFIWRIMRHILILAVRLSTELVRQIHTPCKVRAILCRSRTLEPAAQMGKRKKDLILDNKIKRTRSSYLDGGF